jgi:glycosyltransferase involved in cell wall biosynthesis
MKVLFLAPSFLPRTGGVERHLAKLAGRLLARGHEVAILVPGDGTDPGIEEVGGVTVVRFPQTRLQRSRFRLVRVAGLVATLPRVARALGRLPAPDVVHGHDFAFLHCYLPARLAFPRARFFITFHGITGDRVHRWARAGMRLCGWLARGNICVGGFIRDLYGVRPDEVTIGAVEGPLTPPSHGPRSKALLYIGRLEEDVPLLECIEGVSRSARGGERPVLELYGTGPLEARLAAQGRRLGVEIRFRGRTASPEAVYPGHAIALGGGYLGLMEAIQAGCSVIAYARGPVRLAYYSTHPCAGKGMVVVSSPDGFAAAVRTLDADPAGAAEAVAAGQRIIAPMTWDALADLYERIWRSPD